MYLQKGGKNLYKFEFSAFCGILKTVTPDFFRCKNGEKSGDMECFASCCFWHQLALGCPDF
jgi:hypothetical protein